MAAGKVRQGLDRFIRAKVFKASGELTTGSVRFPIWPMPKATRLMGW